MNGYAKLLVMCAGVGSPAPSPRLRRLLRSKYRDPIFAEGSNYDNPTIRRLMDATLGGGYQRPFELATLRLTNMIEILRNWDALAPTDDELLVQRGGSVVFQDGRVAFRHDDAGILGYCSEERLVKKALSEDPSAAPDPVETMRAAARDRSAHVDDVYSAVAASEKAKKDERRVKGAELNGRWRLVYTSGTKKVAANLNRAGFGGSYFPLPAVQSLTWTRDDPHGGLGPVKFFFDGPFVWRETEHARVHVHEGVPGARSSRPWSVDIDDGKWDAVKEAEQTASSGQGKIERARLQTGASRFHPYTDEECIAARGRGGARAVGARG